MAAGLAAMVGVLAALAIVAAGNARAETLPEAPFAERWQAISSPPKPAGDAARPTNRAPVNTAQALYLIRSTLLTLNDANRSGNYTVLRDLAAPGFQAKNSAADLARIFADLRERRFDLFAAALIAPQLTAPPRLEANGLLRLTGHFPTRPLEIHFDLLFQEVDGQWRLFGLSVATPKASAPQTGAAPKSEKP